MQLYHGKYRIYLNLARIEKWQRNPSDCEEFKDSFLRKATPKMHSEPPA